MEIKKVAVIGSGVMGMGIAAQVANAGLPVVLLDIVPDDGPRSALAQGAISKALKARPAPFMHKRVAKKVTPGNLEDDLEKLADCDLIIEVIIERLELKHALYRKVEAVARPDAIITSNTSTIQRARLIEGMPAERAKRFAITHFFNPPRYMRLLELVAGDNVDADVIDTLTTFCDVNLGKGVVRCKDTPGFIANRLGTMWISSATNAAKNHGFRVDEADVLVGKAFGIPSTGVFALMDLVGLDLMPLVGRSLYDNLPDGDAFRKVFHEDPMVLQMVEKGYTGRKGLGGFYRMNKEGGRKVKEALNLETGEYYVASKPKFDSVEAARKGGPRATLEFGDKTSAMSWEWLRQTLSYCAELAFDICDGIQATDDGMKLGYGWKWGPFELMDRIGPKWIADKLEAEGYAVPALLRAVGDGTFYKVENGELMVMDQAGAYVPVKRADGVLLLSDIKLTSEPLFRGRSASVWDIGDGVLNVEFHSKMNAFEEGHFKALNMAMDTIERDEKYVALTIYNEDPRAFSAGANLGEALFAANTAMWPVVQMSIMNGQKALKRLRFTNFPVVAAPAGLALGGGCEVCLAANAIQGHAELYIGLVEAGVGLVPGWGGCKELIRRHTSNPRGPKGPMPGPMKAFELIATAAVSTSAMEARDNLVFTQEDGITMNRDRLLADAKARALAMVDSGFTSPEPVEFRLPGPSGATAFHMGLDDYKAKGIASDYDMVVGAELAIILSGGASDPTETLGEDDILKMEQESFMKLLKNQKTLARIEHMLNTGKPLRN